MPLEIAGKRVQGITLRNAFEYDQFAQFEAFEFTGSPYNVPANVRGISPGWGLSFNMPVGHGEIDSLAMV